MTARTPCTALGGCQGCLVSLIDYRGFRNPLHALGLPPGNFAHQTCDGHVLFPNSPPRFLDPVFGRSWRTAGLSRGTTNKLQILNDSAAMWLAFRVRRYQRFTITIMVRVLFAWWSLQ
jgi:hypothetical protein